jgi:hypothetical protein
MADDAADDAKDTFAEGVAHHQAAAAIAMNNRSQRSMDDSGAGWAEV